MFTVYTAIYGEVQSDFPPNFPFFVQASPGPAIRFCFGTEQRPFAFAGHDKRADKRIDGLPERNMGTVVLFLYLFVSLPVCRMRFAGQQKRMHGNAALLTIYAYL